MLDIIVQFKIKRRLKGKLYFMSIRVEVLFYGQFKLI